MKSIIKLLPTTIPKFKKNVGESKATTIVAVELKSVILFTIMMKIAYDPKEVATIVNTLIHV